MAGNQKKRQYTTAELRSKAEELARCDLALQVVSNEVNHAIEENRDVDGDIIVGAIDGILQRQEEGVDAIVRGVYMLSRKVDNIAEEKNFINQVHRLEKRRLDLIKAKVAEAIEKHFEGADEDTKHRMEGQLFSLWTQSTGKDKVIIQNPQEIPRKFHRIEVTIKIEDGETFDEVSDMLDAIIDAASNTVNASIQYSDPQIQESWVGDALRHGEEVPGAVLRDAAKHLRMTSVKKVESTLEQIDRANAIEGPVVDVDPEQESTDE